MILLLVANGGKEEDVSIGGDDLLISSIRSVVEIHKGTSVKNNKRSGSSPFDDQITSHYSLAKVSFNNKKIKCQRCWHSISSAGTSLGSSADFGCKDLNLGDLEVGLTKISSTVKTIIGLQNITYYTKGRRELQTEIECG
ncbi:hypothetical protein L1887_32582 [Cichorium endivia]|nr:hypothetical protein L1887_32582 [Cichorium endivia]